MKMYNRICFKLVLGYILLLGITGLGIFTSFHINTTIQQNFGYVATALHTEAAAAALRSVVANVLKDTHSLAQSPEPVRYRSYERNVALTTVLASELDLPGTEHRHTALTESHKSVLHASNTVISQVQAGLDPNVELQTLDTSTDRFYQTLATYINLHRSQLDQHSPLLPRQNTGTIYTIGLCLIVGLLVIGILRLMASALLRPVHRVSAALAAVGQGRFDVALPQRMPTEFAALVASYQTMTEMLRNRQQAFDEQLRQISLLTQISIELRETLDPQIIIERVLKVIAANLAINSASVLIVHTDGTPALAYDMNAGTVKALPIARAQTILERGLAGWALRHNCSVVSSDVSRDSRWFHYSHEHSFAGSAIVVPIRQAHEILGLLTVCHVEPNHFTNRDLLLMEGIASQLGTALSAALRYLSEFQRREQALALLDISQFFTVERSYNDLATLLQEKSASVFGAQQGLLFLGSAANLVTVIMPTTSTSSNNDNAVHHATHIASQAWEGRNIATRRITSGDVALTFVALPLLHGGNAIGAFVLIRSGHDDAMFSANTWSLLTIFTNIIAAICANMHLVATLSHQTEALEALVHQRTAELQRSRDFLRIVFDHLPEGLVLLTENDVLLAANTVFCRDIIGYEPPEVVGQNYATIWQDLEQQAILQIEPQGTFPAFSMHLNQDSQQDALRILWSKVNGQQRWYAVSRIAIAGNDGEVEQYLERWHDVTHQEELHRQLLFHEQLTSLGRLAASVAHEVGNPLQSAVGCLDLCREDTTVSAATREYLDLACSELERMARTLEHLRSLYRSPQTTREYVNINQILEEVQQFTTHQFARRGVHLQLYQDPQLPMIYGQPDGLRQVFLNLALNAEEALPHGGDMVITSQWQQQKQECCILVRDTGIGMCPDQLENLFEPFRSRKARGVGLGLYLSKQIIEQHAGTITVTSTLHQGTTVEIWLPLGG